MTPVTGILRLVVVQWQRVATDGNKWQQVAPVGAWWQQVAPVGAWWQQVATSGACWRLVAVRSHFGLRLGGRINPERA